MDQSSALKVLCRVVEASGFSAAAAGINASHTVMSRQVCQLETLLGAQRLRPRDVYAVHPHSRRFSPKVRAFVDCASEVCRSPAWE